LRTADRMSANLAQKLIRSHLAEGRMQPGEEVALRMDQALLQDATGTVAWLEFEQVGPPRVSVRQATQYVDHNVLQTGFENPDDHLFLEGMAAKYGAVFSPAGNGISHWCHMERFDRPGESMLGADSHTCHAGSLGMLAIGAGGFEVASVMAGEPYRLRMPQVLEVRLTGQLPPWSSAKDVILEVLRRLTVRGGLEKVLEYTGPGLKTLSVPQRGTIANMGQETGATTSVFPSDEQARRWLLSQQREAHWKELKADEGAAYDDRIDIDLSTVEPLIAKPSSPDSVVPVREVAGTEARQVAVGSSVNSSFHDLMTVAALLEGHSVHPRVSMAVSPGSRQSLLTFMMAGGMTKLIAAGVRELEVACGPCIGMGFAPPTHGVSVRTFNRNFPGRSGTAEDLVYLCSPEVAAATALRGVITDPRDLGRGAPRFEEPERFPVDDSRFIRPPAQGTTVPAVRGPNIQPLPMPKPFSVHLQGEVLIKTRDKISTDDILPAGARILPLRSNIPALSEHVFEYVDSGFVVRAKAASGDAFIVGGENYGQGSSREHAAICPMFLGVRAVVAKSFARIHKDNLVNWGILPIVFRDLADYTWVRMGDLLRIEDVTQAVERGDLEVANLSQGRKFAARADLTARQRAILRAGGGLRMLRSRFESTGAHAAPVGA
jgi:predicted aconitate hydratase